MKTVVITGSTRGIGYGMAENFLARGWNVVISGRKQDDVDEKVKLLGEKFDPSQILGQACDVTDFQEVQTLWDEAVKRFEKVDI